MLTANIRQFSIIYILQPPRNTITIDIAIAGQTAGPNRLNFFEETHGYPGGNKGKTKLVFFKNNNL